MLAITFLRRLDRTLASLADGVQDRLERRRERRLLLSLDDRMLHDIALSRADAEAAGERAVERSRS